MWFSKSKCKVLHLGPGKLHYQYELRDIKMEHSPAERDEGVQEDGKMDMSQQCALAVSQTDPGGRR